MKSIIYISLIFVFVLSACQPGQPPATEIDQEPTKTSTPDSQFVGTETVHHRPSIDTEPPAAILRIGESEQISGIGSYCWTDPVEGIMLCKDKVGIPTPRDPIPVEGAFTPRFINPLTTPPDTLVLSTIPVTLEDKMSTEIEGLYWWEPRGGLDSIDLPLTPPHEIDLSLEPGLYVFNIFTQWAEFGDASYGFLVEVSPAQGSESTGAEGDVTTVRVLAVAGLNLRTAPEISSDVLEVLAQNELVDVIGQSPDGDWWQVVCPEGVAGECWISADPAFSEPVNLADISYAGLIYGMIDRQSQRPIWRIEADGTPSLLLENSQNLGSISPDGTHMIGCCSPRGETNLHLIEIKTGESLQLTDTPERYNYNPQWWQANPETIVFVSNVFNTNDQPRPGPGNLAMVKTDGAGFQVLDPERVMHASFSLSPDGETIAYTHGDENASESGILTPWLYQLEAGPTPFDHKAYGLQDYPKLSFGNPTWSSDGKYLAWVIGGELSGDGAWQNGIAIFDLQGQNVVLINPHTPANCLYAWCPSSPVWSPDGKWLTWLINPVGALPSFMVTRPDGGELQTFENAVASLWSPDSQWMLYTKLSDASLMVMHAEEWLPQPSGLPANTNPIMWLSIDE